MKKIRYILLVILVLLTVNVKADNKCETAELNRLKELAKKVEFDYDYKLVDGVAKFSIRAINLNSDLKVLIIEDYYNDKYKQFKDNDSHMATLDGFNSGDRVVITIKGFVPNWCSGKTVLTKTIKIPYYNYYYSEETCRGIEDFKYCKQLVDSNISEKTFLSSFEAYMDSKVSNEPVVEPANNTWKLLIIIGIIVGALMIIVGISVLISKKRKKNQL